MARLVTGNPKVVKDKDKEKGSGKKLSDAAALGKLLGSGAQAGQYVAGQYFSPDKTPSIDSGFDANGNRVGEVGGMLSSFNQLRQRYAVDPISARTTDMKSTIEGLKSGLGGYTAPENQAMREQADREVAGNLASNLSQLSKAQGATRMSGAAAVAQKSRALSDSDRAKQVNEQNLFIKNADEKQKRLEGFANFTQGLEQQEFDRARGVTADSADALMRTREDELGRSKSNIELQQNQKGNYLNTLLGFANLGLQREGMSSDRRLNERIVDAATGTGRGRGRGGNSGSNRGNFYDEAGRLTRDRFRNAR